MDELNDRYNRLKLTEEEEEIPIVKRGGELDVAIADLALVGRLHTDKVINVDAMRRTLSSIWRISRGSMKLR